MPFWRREKPLHERLAEEGGLTGYEPVHTPPPLGWMEAGIHGIARPRQFDAVVAVTAEGIAGNEIAFVALPDGTFLVESGAEVPEGALDPFADALEGSMTTPYRCIGIRKGENQWAAAAKAINVVELPDAAGDVIELAVKGDERTLLVDGERTFGTVPELEELTEEDAYVVRAERLDGDLWEVRAAPL